MDKSNLKKLARLDSELIDKDNKTDTEKFIVDLAEKKIKKLYKRNLKAAVNSTLHCYKYLKSKHKNLKTTEPLGDQPVNRVLSFLRIFNHRDVVENLISGANEIVKESIDKLKKDNEYENVEYLSIDDLSEFEQKPWKYK